MSGRVTGRLQFFLVCLNVVWMIVKGGPSYQTWSQKMQKKTFEWWLVWKVRLIFNNRLVLYLFRSVFFSYLIKSPANSACLTPEKDLYAFFFFSGKHFGLRSPLMRFEVVSSAHFQGLDKIWLSTGKCDHWISTEDNWASPNYNYLSPVLICFHPSGRLILVHRYLEGRPGAWD